MKGIISSGTIKSMASDYIVCGPSRYEEAMAPLTISRELASEINIGLFPDADFFRILPWMVSVV
jgi:hypothetical protein